MVGRLFWFGAESLRGLIVEVQEMERRRKFVRVSSYIRKDGKRVFEYVRRLPKKRKKVERDNSDESHQEPLFFLDGG